MNQRQRKRFVTLIELMIVMLLIGIIGGAVAYNVRGSLEKGRYFRSIEGSKQLENAIHLAIIDHPDIHDIPDRWQSMIADSPILKDPEKAQYDGWGNLYSVTFSSDGQVKVTSTKAEAYKTAHNLP